MKTVPLHGKNARGRVALVDDEDYELVMQYRWWVQERTTPGHRSGPYARTDAGKYPVRQALFMHNLLAGPRPDHIDGDGLNNQRANLRPATAGQNGVNKRKRTRATSRYVGVSWNRMQKKWHARITSEGLTRSLGYFSSQEDAARAYDAAARRVFGEFARVNFPERIACDGDCIEVSNLGGGVVGLRHVHDSGNPVLRLTAGEWRTFIAKAKNGEFDTGSAAA